MSTPGRKFFDEHMAYIYAGDLDGMIDDQYHEDAVLISPFDIYEDKKPPHIVRGRPALKQFFKDYTAWQGGIDVTSLDPLAETEDSILFQAVFSSNTGTWSVGDGWYMRDGMILHHFSFAQRIGEPGT